MNLLAKTLSFLGLGITLFTPLFVWWGWTDSGSLPTAMIIGMLLWFGSAPFWIKREEGHG